MHEFDIFERVRPVEDLPKDDGDGVDVGLARDDVIGGCPDRVVDLELLGKRRHERQRLAHVKVADLCSDAGSRGSQEDVGALEVVVHEGWV